MEFIVLILLAIPVGIFLIHICYSKFTSKEVEVEEDEIDLEKEWSKIEAMMEFEDKDITNIYSL